MNAKPVELPMVCVECGSDDLYGPEPNFWGVMCLSCSRRYSLLEDDRPAGKRPRKFRRLR